MYSRRKNGDSNRNKRLPKRYRVFEFLSSSCIQHTKVVLIWMMFLFLNYSTGMRVEYFWPGWLFLCSINESLRFEGLHFAFVFILIVLATDLICFLVIPVTWLFYFGSAYVWIYLLWHIDKGVCLPTCVLFLIFMYFEIEFRSKDLKCTSHSIYLFRPFAAHCIGYPAVCIGFSMKNYLEIKYKMRKKMDVRIHNETYYSMLNEALYPSLSEAMNDKLTTNGSLGASPTPLTTTIPNLPSTQTSSMCNNNSNNGASNNGTPTLSPMERIVDEFDEKRTFNEIKLTSCLLNGDLEYRSCMDSGFAAILFYPFTCPDTNIFDSKKFISTFVTTLSTMPVIRSMLAIKTFIVKSLTKSFTNPQQMNTNSDQMSSYSMTTNRMSNSSLTKYQKPSEINSDDNYTLNLATSTTTTNHHHQNNTPLDNIQIKKNKSTTLAQCNLPLLNNGNKGTKRVDINVKLENTVKKLRTDLHSIKAAENQLRLQLSQIEAESKALRESYAIQRQENDLLSSEISKLTIQNKADKIHLNQIENQILVEKKSRKAIEESIIKLKTIDTISNSLTKNKSTNNSGININNNYSTFEASRQNCTCGDDVACRQKLKRLENDLKNMQLQIRQRDDSLKMANCSFTKNAWQTSKNPIGSISLQQQKQLQLDDSRKTLMNRISMMNNERNKMTNKLREYSKLQEELMAAFNKSHNGILELKNTLSQRDNTINQLKAKLSKMEVLQNQLDPTTFSGDDRQIINSPYDLVNGSSQQTNNSMFDDVLNMKQNMFCKNLPNTTNQRVNHDPWGFVSTSNSKGNSSFNYYTNSMFDNNQSLTCKSISPPVNSNGGGIPTPPPVMTNNSFLPLVSQAQTSNHSLSCASAVINQHHLTDILSANNTKNATTDDNQSQLQQQKDCSTTQKQFTNNTNSLVNSRSKVLSKCNGSYNLFNNLEDHPSDVMGCLGNGTTNQAAGRLSGLLGNLKNHNFSSPVLRQCAKNAMLETLSSDVTYHNNMSSCLTEENDSSSFLLTSNTNNNETNDVKI